MSGFQGLSASGDPNSGTVWVTTDWATVEDLLASRTTAERIRQQSTETLDTTIVGAREWVTPVSASADNPPTAGLPVNVNRHFYEPTLVQDVVSFFAWVAEPKYSSSPGFRSVRMLVDRTTGEVQVESVWDDVASLDEGLKRTEPLRDRAVEKGMKRIDRTQREFLFISSSLTG